MWKSSNCLYPWEPVSSILPTLASSVSLPLEVKRCMFLTDWTINRALQYICRGSQPGGNRCHFVCGFLCLLKLLVSDQFVKWLLYSTGMLQMCKGCCCPSPSSESNCHLLYGCKFGFVRSSENISHLSKGLRLMSRIHMRGIFSIVGVKLTPNELACHGCVCDCSEL